MELLGSFAGTLVSDRWSADMAVSTDMSRAVFRPQ
jgi:hypothetical protein